MFSVKKSNQLLLRAVVNPWHGGGVKKQAVDGLDLHTHRTSNNAPTFAGPVAGWFPNYWFHPFSFLYCFAHVFHLLIVSHQAA